MRAEDPVPSQEIQHDGDESICDDGRLNLELLRKEDEVSYHTAQTGVTWKMLTKEAALQLPHLSNGAEDGECHTPVAGA